MVEGVFLRCAHGGLQRLGQPRNGRLHHVHRRGHPIVHRCSPSHDQPLRRWSDDVTLPVSITCAPCCWGVDDVSNPHLPSWERVLDEATEAGFGGLELGPYGYMPLDSGRTAAALEARRLRIVAGTIFDDLVSPANRQNLVRQTNEICALITSLPRPESHRGQ